MTSTGRSGRSGRLGWAGAVETQPGGAVLSWLGSAEATVAARRAVRRWGLPGGDQMVDDVLGDAIVQCLSWQRGPSAHDPDNPAAYGTTIIRSSARRMLEGRRRSLDVAAVPLDALAEALPDPTADPTAGDPHGHPDGTGRDRTDRERVDDIRVAVEEPGGHPWLVSAALSVVTFGAHPEALPDDGPAPIAGARPDQARVWPALHLAGETDLFPGPDGDPPARRRTRSRRITAVLERLASAASRARLDRERSAHDG